MGDRLIMATPRGMVEAIRATDGGCADETTRDPYADVREGIPGLCSLPHMDADMIPAISEYARATERCLDSIQPFVIAI